MPVEVLGELRHACALTGACCHGHFVHVSAAETARLEAMAPEFGVERPVVDGQLRRENTGCVFIGDTGLCRIHAKHGAAAKPLICQQYPLVAIRAGESVRVGIDPGCVSAWSSWDSGPEIDAGRLVATPVPLDPRLLGLEDQLVDACDAPDAFALVRQLVGEGPGEGVPPGFARELLRKVKTGRLSERLMHPDTAASLRLRLRPVAERIDALDPADPPPLTLSPDVDAWVREGVKRVIWLRLAHRVPHPAAAALLTLSGAALVGWTHHSLPAFGPAFAAWTRVMRSPEVVGILFPRTDSAT
jgi:Fe-S-cluster containining protein